MRRFEIDIDIETPSNSEPIEYVPLTDAVDRAFMYFFDDNDYDSTNYTITDSDELLQNETDNNVHIWSLDILLISKDWRLTDINETLLALLILNELSFIDIVTTDLSLEIRIVDVSHYGEDIIAYQSTTDQRIDPSKLFVDDQSDSGLHWSMLLVLILSGVVISMVGEYGVGSSVVVVV